MIIELFGLPGSGKTTIKKTILKRFKFVTWETDKVRIIYHFLKNNEIGLSKKTLQLSRILKYVPLINKIYFELLFHSKLKFSQSVFMKSSVSICTRDVIDKICSQKSLTNDMKPHYISWEIEKITRIVLCQEYIKDTNKICLIDEGIVTIINNFGIDLNTKLMLA